MKFSLRILVVIFTLMLSACVTNGGNVAATKTGAKLDRAKFEAYGFQTLFMDASHLVCDYGKERIAELDVGVPPEHKIWGGNFTYITHAMYPVLKCHWLALDGTPQEEIVRAVDRLLPKYVEWEHFEGEEVVEYQPLQMGGVTMTIFINNKNFSISRDFNVQLYGESLPDNARRIKAVEVKQLVFKRK